MLLRGPRRTRSNAWVAVGIAAAFVLLSGSAAAATPSPEVPTGSPGSVGVTPSTTAATVNLSSSVPCAAPPRVIGFPSVASVTLPAPGGYSISATQFCGTSVLYSWNFTGGAFVRNATEVAYNLTDLYVAYNGTVTAHYMTEPPGEYPVVFWNLNWPLTHTSWGVSVGWETNITNSSAVVIGVPNGTYILSSYTVAGITQPIPGGPYRVIVNGMGVLLDIPLVYEHLGASFPPSAVPGTPWLYPLLLATLGTFAVVGLIVGVATWTKTRKS